MRKILKVFLTILTMAVLVTVMSGCKKETDSEAQMNNEKAEGKLLITVTDKESKQPVSNAHIFIMGVENEYLTDEKGVSPEITLDVNKDIYKRYGEDLYGKAPSGCATVLITKEGYKDYIVFNKAIYPGYAANTLKVELTQLEEGDEETYTVDIERPHDVWVEELINQCELINQGNEGTGKSKISITVKDSNSKPLADVYAVIPELNLKVKTDENGQCTLKPDTSLDVFNTYPVEKELPEYTIVLMKEGYVPTVVFNATVNEDDGDNLSFTLNPVTDKEENELNVNCLEFDNEWVEEVIENLKEQVQE